MGNYVKEDIDRWFDYNYLSTQRIVYVGSHTPETDESIESGTDCQMAEYFIKAMVHLNNISSKPIFLHMNNPGGDWFHGMAMYDAIRASKAHVYGICWGYAMSMGSIIMQACDSRIVAPNCTLMIHDGSEALIGACKSVEAWARDAERARKIMYRIYLSRMKAAKPTLTIGQVEKLCLHDNIYPADAAIESGLADWILETLEDPYKYYATDTQGAKWQSGMKLGKHEAEEEEEGD